MVIEIVHAIQNCSYHTMFKKFEIVHAIQNCSYHMMFK